MINKTFRKLFSYFLTKIIYNGICFLDELLEMFQERLGRESPQEKQEELLGSLINALRDYKQYIAESSLLKQEYQEGLEEEIQDDKSITI